MKRRNNATPNFARIFPSLSKHFQINANIHMFSEDVYMGIMPFRYTSQENDKINVCFQGDGEQCSKARSLFTSFEEYSRYDDKETVCDAVESIARHLAWEGQANFEILYDDSNGIYLENFTSKRLLKFLGCYIQFIPQKEWEHFQKKVAFSFSKNIWHIEMPTALGGKYGYKKILNRLKKFNGVTPRFISEDLNTGVFSKNFDVQLYARNSEVFFRRATKEWGWNRRNMSQDLSTEFFTFYKLITFRWAQAVLREHIINEFNRLFTRLNIASKVVVCLSCTYSHLYG